MYRNNNVKNLDKNIIRNKTLNKDVHEYEINKNGEEDDDDNYSDSYEVDDDDSEDSYEVDDINNGIDRDEIRET